MSKPVQGLMLMKAALFSSVVAYVLLGSLLPFTPEDAIGVSAEASRRILTFFALTALAVVLFPRARATTLGVAMVGLAGGIELLQFAPLFGHSPDLLDVISAVAGVVIALGPAVIGREFPLQPKGASPTSLSFLP